MCLRDSNHTAGKQHHAMESLSFDAHLLLQGLHTVADLHKVIFPQKGKKYGNLCAFLQFMSTQIAHIEHCMSAGALFHEAIFCHVGVSMVHVAFSQKRGQGRCLHLP